MFGYPISPLRTRDVDILVPLDKRIPGEVDIPGMLSEIGFVVDYSWPDGHMRIMHPELIVEFIVPDKGMGLESPYELPILHINSEPLRFVDILIKEPVRVEKWGVRFFIPSPQRYAVHKLIVSVERRGRDKAERDYRNAVEIISMLEENDMVDSLKGVFEELSSKRKKMVLGSLKGSPYVKYFGGED